MQGVLHGERILGAVLAGIGVLALYQVADLPIGSLREPGAGLFPVVVASALILFSALALLSRTRDADPLPAEPGGIGGVWILIAALAAYGWLLPSAGFVVCTAVLLGMLLRRPGGVGWPATVICAVGGAAGCYFLFTRLGMPLPAGLLGF